MQARMVGVDGISDFLLPAVLDRSCARACACVLCVFCCVCVCCGVCAGGGTDEATATAATPARGSSSSRRSVGVVNRRTTVADWLGEPDAVLLQIVDCEIVVVGGDGTAAAVVVVVVATSLLQCRHSLRVNIPLISKNYLATVFLFFVYICVFILGLVFFSFLYFYLFIIFISLLLL
jgi:hypothetical protein